MFSWITLVSFTLNIFNFILALYSHYLWEESYHSPSRPNIFLKVLVAHLPRVNKSNYQRCHKPIRIAMDIFLTRLIRCYFSFSFRKKSRFYCWCLTNCFFFQTTKKVKVVTVCFCCCCWQSTSITNIL